jgi:oligopeptide transport system permease protein
MRMSVRAYPKVPDQNLSQGSTVVERPRSLGADAWDAMKRRPLFWIAVVLVILFIIVAAFPWLFSAINYARADTACMLDVSRMPPRSGAIFGNDLQGCDIYSRVIYGARSSILVGTLTALVCALFGGALGTIAGYLGGWVDALLSRIADIFFAIPLLLGAIVLMSSIPITVDSPYPLIIFRIVLAMALFGWPNIFRLMRAAVIQVKPNEYVLAARALGARPLRMAISHIIPNALTPLIVVSTIDLGTYIATEATLSFLGIGLPWSVVSWGADIARASGLGYIRNAPHMLLFPAAALCLTVLAFIMLGEVVRDAFDPKLR